SSMWRGRRALVTGGAGFIGSHLVDALLASGASVVVLDDCSSGRTAQVPEGAELVSASISDASSRSTALSGCSAVFHLAAIASVVRCEDDPELSASVNRQASLDLLAEAGIIGVGAFVFASSAAVYGEPQHLPITESHPLAPLATYGADKAVVDEAITTLGIEGVAATALRFFNVYGSRQDPSSPYSGVLSIFTQRASSGEGVTIFGDGLQTRDFVHVSDVVSAMMAAGESLLTLGTASPAHATPFNVCSGVTVTLLDVVAALDAITQQPMDVTHAPAREGEIRDSFGDPAALTAALDWTPEVTLEEGLRDLMEQL
ncbi:MAG: NAD-dependent epimerase/dehydratase family protein, partial [Candidatus Poseidoniales archaeon]|nr:NAD-dependent epimerase/dehydratase family protein [Candidatus Poseidoniales archaeon]